MNKIYKCIILIVICMMCMSVATAENPAADKYRKIFSSGEYFIEYEMEHDAPHLTADMKKHMPKDIKSLAVRNGEIKVMVNRYMSDLRSKNTIADLTLGVYKNGKYYYCVDKKKGYLFKADKLSDVLNLNMAMNSEALYAKTAVMTDMKLPDAVRNIFFMGNDDTLAVMKPVYEKSYQQTIDGSTFDVDEYVSSVTAMNFAYETMTMETSYKVYYQNAILYQIIIGGGLAGGTSIYKFNTINNVVTDDMLSIPAKYKFYAPPMNDMSGLLGNNGEVLEET